MLIPSLYSLVSMSSSMSSRIPWVSYFLSLSLSEPPDSVFPVLPADDLSRL